MGNTTSSCDTNEVATTEVSLFSVHIGVRGFRRRLAGMKVWLVSEENR